MGDARVARGRCRVRTYRASCVAGGGQTSCLRMCIGRNNWPNVDNELNCRESQARSRLMLSHDGRPTHAEQEQSLSTGPLPWC